MIFQRFPAYRANDSASAARVSDVAQVFRFYFFSRLALEAVPTFLGAASHRSGYARCLLMPRRRLLIHKMVRIPRSVRSRLLDSSQRWDIPQAVVIRVALDDALAELRDLSIRRDVPEPYTRQEPIPKYSTEDRKVLINTYVTKKQVAELARVAKSLRLQYSDILRAGLVAALEELEALDPEAATLPRRYQDQVRLDSYSGFTPKRTRVTPSMVDRLAFHVAGKDVDRLIHLSQRLQIPFAVIVRVGLQHAMNELEQVETPRSLPDAYRDSHHRGIRRKPLRNGRARSSRSR